MIVRTGTSGFSYREWKGHFYPDDIPASRMLSYYAGRLGAVEINSSFYRIPRKSVLEEWRTQVPEDFRFCLKASRRITHFNPLSPPWDATDHLLEVASILRNTLGALLFQLPPTQRKDTERIRAFLEHLPDPSRAAFEFRHPEWYDSQTYSLLERFGCVLVVSDDGRLSPADLPETATTGYLRLRRPSYSDSDLAEWARRLTRSAWKEVFVFFKHEDSGAGPRLAERFLHILETNAPR